MTDALDRIAAMRRWPRDRALGILEVGAGLAWMCRAAKARNPACVTVAQDVSPEAATRCAWVDRYVQGSVDDPRLDADAPYDVISLTHVIEHVVDPVTTLRRCLALLRAGGVVFVTAPYRPRGWRDDAPDLRRFEAYSYNHVPAHIQYFAEGSMRRLVSAAGGRLAHWSHAHDGGQAFEAWITGAMDADSDRRVRDGRLPRFVRRARRFVGRILLGARRRLARTLYGTASARSLGTDCAGLRGCLERLSAIPCKSENFDPAHGSAQTTG